MAVCVKGNNVYASSFALLMSVVAWCLGIAAFGKVAEAFGSMGSGTILRDSAFRAVIHLSLSMILNIVSFMAICCSTFHFEQAMKFDVVHSLTSSTAFCVLRIAAFTTFLVQLACSSLMLVGMSSVLTLDFICHMGSTVQFHAQEVIWEIGNFTLTGRDPFDPYHTGNLGETKAADTRFVSVASMMQHLSLERFCPYSENVGAQLFIFWSSGIASLVSQALMAIALNGEKERISVHEEHEEARGVAGMVPLVQSAVHSAVSSPR